MTVTSAFSGICCVYCVQCICIAVIPSLDPALTVSDHILTAVLALLKKEVSEHGRHIAQYFHLFLSYSNLGISEVRSAVKYAHFPSNLHVYIIRALYLNSC